MKCYLCGGTMESEISDMPFKLSSKTIVILKELPVLQCNNCGEYAIEDSIMEKVEALLSRVDQEAELEIVRFAA
ncbi:MAG: type II toxin-antitoxin system MqsA family antitoxin [Leptospirillum sp.]